MSHNKPAPQDLSPWYKVHGDHQIEMLATDQVQVVCHTCQIRMTADEIEAGFAVTKRSAQEANGSYIEPEQGDPVDD